MSRRLGSDLNLRPKQDVSAQPISGIFVSFADLGIANGATIYGFSLFPNDVTSSMNLISLTNVPTNTNQGTDGGLDLMAGMGYFAENSMLPNLEWDFKLRKTNGEILLNWNNSFSDQVKSFVIERSDNGQQFSVIGERRIIGNISELEFADERTPRIQKIYYRIKAIKYDGSYLYSNTLFVSETPSLNMNIYPNPFTHYIQTEISSEINQKLKMSWMNSNGTILKEEIRTLSKGLNHIRLEPPSALPVGKYFLQVMIDDGRKKTLQVVKN
jgi:hypothetical protein